MNDQSLLLTSGSWVLRKALFYAGIQQGNSGGLSRQDYVNQRSADRMIPPGLFS